MKETTPAAMPPCFDRWCQKFDDIFKTKAQKTGFRHYLGGLLGESSRKNLTQIPHSAPPTVTRKNLQVRRYVLRTRYAIAITYEIPIF